MKEKHVWVFFYGLYMDFEILAKHGLVPQQWEVAKLYGFNLQIASWGNLAASDRDCVYGIVVAATHEHLTSLYSVSSSILTKQYFPEAVLVETLEGKQIASLCYSLPEPPEGPINTNYVERMIELSKRFDFPEWYIERIAGFMK